MAELLSVYPKALIHQISNSIAILEGVERVDQKALNRLGGTVKIAQLEQKTSKNSFLEGILEALLADHTSGKLNYGISLYGLPASNLRKILLDLKKLLKSAGISSRFANQNFQNLSIPQYKGLKGPEIIITPEADGFLVGRVVATQDIDAYSQRDYQKPFRSMKVGMLPPKLAQILINLTGSKGPIWDPFCGGGVLLMEGLLMGHDMVGSDIDEQTLEGAKKNVSWLKQAFSLNSKADLFAHDATDPMPSKKVAAIAFEGYLGPPQTKLKSERELRPLISQLDQLYLLFFQQLKKAKFKGPIVAALPFFKALQGREVSLSCPQKIQELGFQIQSLLSTKNSLSLRYARQDQLVGREIFRFTQV